MTMTKVYWEDVFPNFTRDEIVCRCDYDDCPKLFSLAWVLRLQELRYAFGQPIKINSCARCEKHNKDVGGAPGSWHVKLQAADLAIDHLSEHEVRNLRQLIATRFFGYGIYEKHIHIDGRAIPAFWTG